MRWGLTSTNTIKCKNQCNTGESNAPVLLFCNMLVYMSPNKARLCCNNKKKTLYRDNLQPDSQILHCCLAMTCKTTHQEQSLISLFTELCSLGDCFIFVSVLPTRNFYDCEFYALEGSTEVENQRRLKGRRLKPQLIFSTCCHPNTDTRHWEIMVPNPLWGDNKAENQVIRADVIKRLSPWLNILVAILRV